MFYEKHVDDFMRGQRAERRNHYTETAKGFLLLIRGPDRGRLTVDFLAIQKHISM
jgi:hypothetical protein